MDKALQSLQAQQLGIGGASLQPNFPRSIIVQGTNGNNVVNRVFQGTNMNNVGSRVTQQLAIGGASMQPNFSRSMVVQGANGNNVGNIVFQETGGNIVVNIVFQRTNINNAENRVLLIPPQHGIGATSLQPNFPRSIFIKRTEINNVGNRVIQVSPQQVGLMSQSRTDQLLNTNHQNVASQPLMTSFVAPQISQGNDAMEVSSIDGTKDYICWNKVGLT
ncbi:hypothetical protein P8452_02985 [Trifolium repens]|nr:hypothetical protein P8452_02985 [Trifolium repens]